MAYSMGLVTLTCPAGSRYCPLREADESADLCHCQATPNGRSRTRYARSPVTTPRARARMGMPPWVPRLLFEIVGIVVGIFVVYHVVRALRADRDPADQSVPERGARAGSQLPGKQGVASGLGDRGDVSDPHSLRWHLCGSHDSADRRSGESALRPPARLHRPVLRIRLRIRHRFHR